MSEEFHLPPLGFVVDVINQWSPSVRDCAQTTDPPSSLDELMRVHDVELHGVTSGVLLSPLAEELWAVFGAERLEARLDVINRVALRSGLRPVATVVGMRWACNCNHPVEAALAATLVEYQRRDPTLQRLGTCAAHRCCDAYVDATQAVSRRYCSVTCQNRAKTAARRARRP